MSIEFIRKWNGSGGTNCPALYLDNETGDYIVQGWKLEAAEFAQLRDVADGENAVRVPADVIAGIVARAGA